MKLKVILILSVLAIFALPIQGFAQIEFYPSETEEGETRYRFSAGAPDRGDNPVDINARLNEILHSNPNCTVTFETSADGVTTVIVSPDC